MTTAMAAVLAPTYAPELDIVGSAYGGAPMDIGEILAPGAGLSIADPAVGMSVSSPDHRSSSRFVPEIGRGTDRRGFRHH